MKFVVIGLGQCGGRIADEFAIMNRRAQSERRVRIITGAYAVNTDEAGLSGLTTISADYQHRILLGGRKTTGHGVGKINELGAEIAREGGDKIIDAIRATKRFYETDAFLIVAATAGGTGSGSLPIVTQLIKERYRDKPVYALAVLPFEHEVNAEARGVYNTATCLKSVYQVADAIFLADNQRYLRKDSSLKNNMDAINKQIVAPFYNLLCAGEEKKRQYIGARVVDAGDIIQTLGGWSTIGFGASTLERLKVPIEKKRDFRKKGAETLRGLQAMD
ncbi:MAG: cell division protein FtsZ, partial [Dehalococcoidia bacterium]|nr:cell division protein FtsZ [Dehalococcoidia bacterium]